MITVNEFVFYSSLKVGRLDSLHIELQRNSLNCTLSIASLEFEPSPLHARARRGLGTLHSVHVTRI